MKIAEILEIADKGTSWTMEIGGAYKPTSYQVTDIPKKMESKLRALYKLVMVEGI